MAKQRNIPDDAHEDVDVVAPLEGAEPERGERESLAEAVERVRADDDFTTRARRLLHRDREIIDRLGR